MRATLIAIACLAGCSGEEPPEVGGFRPDLAFPPIFDLVPSCPSSNFGFSENWTAPAGRQLGACTDDELDTFVAVTSAGGIAAFKQFETEHFPCGTCLLADTGAGAIIQRVPGFLDGNIGGCVALLEGRGDLGSCAERVGVAADCAADACAGCRVQVAADLVAYGQCVMAANSSSCFAFASNTSCIDQVAGASACQPSGWSSTSEWLRFLGALFCGPAGDL